MKFLIGFVLVFATIFSAYAENNNSIQAKLETFIKVEVAKELEGKKSCLNGKISKKSAEMEATYGGRYSKKIEVQSIPESTEVYRFLAQYCDGYLDKDMKPTEDEKKRAYRRCVNKDIFTYRVIVHFDFSTSGTVGFEGIHLPATVELTRNVIVKADANYNPEVSDIIRYGESIKIKCGLK